ncbi:MAG: hypothetical protein RIN56_04525 [Sporomusaceae bacterium]|nr:hypothetical protein [Sporomusaceae bacterium]
MTQSLGNPDKVKMMLSGSILVVALYCYFDFILDVGDMYPNMIWDEVVTGLLGVGFVLIWRRFLGRR